MVLLQLTAKMKADIFNLIEVKTYTVNSIWHKLDISELLHTAYTYKLIVINDEYISKTAPQNHDKNGTFSIEISPNIMMMYYESSSQNSQSQVNLPPNLVHIKTHCYISKVFLKFGISDWFIWRNENGTSMWLISMVNHHRQCCVISLNLLRISHEKEIFVENITWERDYENGPEGLGDNGVADEYLVSLVKTAHKLCNREQV